MCFAIQGFSSVLNEESKIIDERYYKELVSTAYDSISMAKIYVGQVPNVRSEPKKMSSRMARLKKSDLIGCLNKTGVTSSNYKEFMPGSLETDDSFS